VTTVSDADGAVVRVDRVGPVALVELHRPRSRNAIDSALAHAFRDAVERAQDAAAIVVTGADPAFCAGLDLRDLGVERLTDLPSCSATVAASSIPVIAAVNGPAVTGGLELALACDFIVASDRAAFADTHLKVGVYPGPVVVDLPRRVGGAWARQLSLTGEFIDARTALRIGLVNSVVPHEDLVETVVDLAASIAAGDRSMIADMRREWDELEALAPSDAHARHRATASALGRRDDRGHDLARAAPRVLDPERGRGPHPAPTSDMENEEDGYHQME
jgi:enoyl-CoA hydratase